MKRSTAVLILVALPVVLLPVAATLTGLFDDWEMDVYDLLCRVGADGADRSDLVDIIMIDLPTLAWGVDYFERNRDNEMGHIFLWPWNRAVYDLIGNYLAMGGARVLVYDFEISSPYPCRDGLEGDATLGSGTRDQNADGNPFIIHTLNFAESPAPPGPLSPREMWNDPFLAGSAMVLPGGPGDIPWWRSDRGYYVDPILPYTEILEPFRGQEHLLRLGVVCVQPDSDSVIRRVRPMVMYHHWYFPSLGLAAAIAYVEARDGAGTAEVRLEDGDLVLRQNAAATSKRMPLTESGDVLIKWRDDGRIDPGKTYFRIVPAHLILRNLLAMGDLALPPDDLTAEELLDPTVFEDRIVFLGANAPGLYDLKAVPVSSNYPGVKVHAALAESIIEGGFMSRLGGVPRCLLAALLSAAALLATLRIRSARLKLAILLAVATAFIAAGIWLFQGSGLWIDFVTPVLGMALAYTGGTTYNYLTEGRRSREISRMFKHFAPPDVVQQLIADPDALNTRGKKMNITIFFSDIQSFTTISNTPEMRSDPERLTAHLNAYLSAMTSAITDCGGTLDKYIGDAVVAFFGAPLELDNHARAACRAALECQRRIEVFNADAAAEDLPAFITRIGLYTGEATVGCVGSRERFSYTAIGSPVNFASRLEGVNKTYGTLVLAGGPTAAMAGDGIRFRFLDRIRVPGVAEDAPALEIHEVLATEGSAIPLDSEALMDFEKARALYETGRFAEAGALFDKIRKICNDPPSSVFYKRCADYVESAPDDSWNGVYRIDSK